MRRPIRVAGMVLVALLASPRAFALDARPSLVPWKVLEPGTEPLKTAFVLFWIPTSPDEMRHSDLITSYRLTLYAGRCVGMQVVRSDDRPMLAKLAAGQNIPLAVLVEGEKEIARIGAAAGVLTASAVEAMVREAIDRREIELSAALDRASAKAAAGDTASAIELYREVAAQGCLFSRLAKTAHRALRRLGFKP